MAAPSQTTPDAVEASAWPLDQIEVRFESDEAFERGLRLAGSGDGVRVFRADPERRRLVLCLHAAEAGSPTRTRSGTRTLH